MENNPLANQSCLSSQEMLSILHSREDIFQLAQETPRYLSEKLPSDQLASRVKLYALNLKAAAEASLFDSLISEEYEHFPVTICTGADADWLWFWDRVSNVFRLPTNEAIRTVLDACLDLLNNCRPGTPCDPTLAAEVMADLQTRFGFLSNCFGADGSFSIVYPSIAAPHDRLGFGFGKTFLDSPEIRLTMLASPNDAAPKDMIRFLYLAAAYSVVVLGNHGLPGEEDLQLLERTVAPDIRAMDLDKQTNAFVDAIKLGLSYGGKHVDFAVYPHSSEEDRLAWRDYVAATIIKIGENRIPG